MLLYILIFLIILNYIDIIKDKNKICLSLIVLFALSTLSKGFGTDYLSYEYIYSKFAPGTYTLSKDLEFGFQILLLLFKLGNIDYHIFSVFVSSTIIIVILFWIFRNAEEPIVSVILFYSLFFIVWSQSAYRQGLALAFGSALFYDRKINLKFPTMFLMTLVLYSFHASALYYLFIYLLLKINWTKKRHIVLLSVSLLFTFLPVENILSYFDAAKIVDISEKYVRSSVGFFDFPSLIRLLFFLIVFIYYDTLVRDDYTKKITDSFLIGISLYFFLKFSEITASRTTIYTFILLVFLFPKILKCVSEKFTHKKLIHIFLLSIVSVTFLTKEVIAYKNQVGYVGDLPIFDIETIYNFNYSNYDNFYAARNSNELQAIARKNHYLKKFDKKKVEEYKEGLQYTVVKTREGKSGVLNSNGNWLMEPKKGKIPILYGDVLAYNTKDNILSNHEYIDLTDKNRTEEQLIQSIVQFQGDAYLNRVVKETKLDIGFFDLISDPSEFIAHPHRVGNSFVVRVDQADYTYHILYFKYYNYYYYLYFDSNLNLFSSDIITEPNRFDANGFLKAKTYSGKLIYNKEGKVIWYE